jgi:hypothetical protein
MKVSGRVSSWIRTAFFVFELARVEEKWSGRSSFLRWVIARLLSLAKIARVLVHFDHVATILVKLGSWHQETESCAMARVVCRDEQPSFPT